MTKRNSSYLQYLPPVLWQDEPEAPEFSLGRFLLVFEQILTGLDDQSSIAYKGYQHASLEQTLDELHKLYNPFMVRSQDSTWLDTWLKYLASLVGLELLPDWDKYQKRKLISDAVHIYNLRGLKQGILKALEIHAVSELKPRIAIDTGESVFRIPLEGERAGKAHVVFSGPPILHPLSVEIDRTSKDSAYRGRIIIGDAGPSNLDGDPHEPQVHLWRITAYGQLDYQSQNGRIVPEPLYDSAAHSGDTHLVSPVAIVDDPGSSSDNPGFYAVADNGGEQAGGERAKILRVEKSPRHPVTLVWRGDASISGLVDMARNADGKYVVLDHGRFPDHPAKILVINPEAVPDGTPSGAVEMEKTLELEAIVAPTALAIFHVHPDDYYIVADAGDPFAEPPIPTEIYKIKSTGGETIRLLPLDQERPVYPTSVYVEDTNHLLILDRGVKGGVMKPAVVWRLSLPQDPLPQDLPAPPPLEAVSRDVSYVWPKDMTKDLKGNLIVADQGSYHTNRDWRRHPYEFGVVLYTPGSPEEGTMRRAIVDIVHAEKPAGTRFWLRQEG